LLTAPQAQLTKENPARSVLKKILIIKAQTTNTFTIKVPHIQLTITFSVYTYLQE